jgi:hypothetical protein
MKVLTGRIQLENVYNHDMHDMTDNLLVSAAPSG